jgi:hypothetical protein
MILIAFAIVFGGLGAFSMSSSSSSSSSAASTTGATSSAQPAAAPTEAPVSSSVGPAPQSPTTSAAPIATTTAPDQAGPVDKSVSVRVLNNSMVHGLAATYANRLRSDGWTNLSTGNYPGSDAELSQITVYYGDAPGERAAAQAIAGELGATALPKSQGVAVPTPGVVVIVTSG